jgi:hypothetical protein
VSLAAVVCALAFVPAAGSAEPVNVFRGLGSWVDIFAPNAWSRPDAVVASLRREGVGTLYLQTSNYSQRRAIVYPPATSRFIESAHRAGLRVVAWFLPGFASPGRDLARAEAAVAFRTAGGQQFDGFGLDIEASVEPNVTVRNARLLALLAAIRRYAPAGYAVGAIIPSPVGMRRHPHYWPRFPYRGIARFVDAFLPMAYFSHYTNTDRGAFTYTRGVVRAIRTRTGDPQVTIHLIGGIADRIGRAGLAGFTRAVSACAVEGVSLYAYPETSVGEWFVLRRAATDATPAAGRC